MVSEQGREGGRGKVGFWRVASPISKKLVVREFVTFAVRSVVSIGQIGGPLSGEGGFSGESLSTARRNRESDRILSRP